MCAHICAYVLGVYICVYVCGMCMHVCICACVCGVYMWAGVCISVFFIKTVLFCFDKNLILLYKGKVVTADSLGQAVHPARCAPSNVAQ